MTLLSITTEGVIHIYLASFFLVSLIAVGLIYSISLEININGGD